jgi:hypothetical protein
VVQQLIDARIEKSHELNFADRLEALRRHADAEAGDQRFRQRRVKDTLAPEAPL